MADESTSEGKDVPGKQSAGSNSADSGRRRFWKWIAGVAAVVVAAIFVPYATSLGNHLSDSLNQAGHPEGLPVIVQYVAAAPFAGDTFAFPQPLDVSHAQLMAFDSTRDQYMPGWVGRNENYPWAWKHGGAVVGGAVIKLDVQGNRKTAVRIEDMQLAEQCHSPATGTLFYSPSAGSGPVVRMGFNLDQAHPIAQLISEDGTFSGPYFLLQNTITLGYGEQQQIQLLVTTKKHYCEFRIDMSVIDGSNVIHEMIGNGSQPFRVTAAITAPDPSDPSFTTIKFAAYHSLYVGGVAPNPCHGWARANPLTYDPQSPRTNAVTC